MLNISTLLMPPENTNSILIDNGADAVIFDPFGHADDWEKLLSKRNLNLVGIYATHGHPDHISAAPQLSRAHKIPWHLHSNDHIWVGQGNELLTHFGLPNIPDDYEKPTALPIKEETILGEKVLIIDMPGHSAGGAAFYFPNLSLLLTGDSIFQDNVGRCDLPGGDWAALQKSISKIVALNLPDDTTVIHGHGANTTIKFLKQHNPYFI